MKINIKKEAESHVERFQEVTGDKGQHWTAQEEF